MLFFDLVVEKCWTIICCVLFSLLFSLLNPCSASSLSHSNNLILSHFCIGFYGSNEWTCLSTSAFPFFQDCVPVEWRNRLQGAGGSGGGVCEGLHSPWLQSDLNQSLHLRGKLRWFKIQLRYSLMVDLTFLDICSSHYSLTSPLPVCPSTHVVSIFYPCPSFYRPVVWRNQDHYWRESSECRQRRICEDWTSPLPFWEVSKSKMLNTFTVFVTL